MYQKTKKKKKYNSNQTLNGKEEKNGLSMSFNDIINEKEKEMINNIKKRPKTYENKLKNNKEYYQIGGYLIKNNLGEGTFGKVKLGIYLQTGEKFAVKIIDKKKLIEKNDQIHLKRELDLLQKLNHINIISVYEIFENIDNYFIVMEYCSKGELFNYIVNKQRLNENEASFFFYQLINGLEYIHSIGISHRDIKPENLLLTYNHVLKIIDFGLSNYYKENFSKYLQTPCGSPCYSSPEMVSGKAYDGFKVDIWSCGIVLFAMLCGYLPFDDKNDDKIIFKKIVECEVKYPFFLSDISKDIINKLLIKDPNKRINMRQIKIHPFYLKGKKRYESVFGITNKSKMIINLTDRSFFQKKNRQKENEKCGKNESSKNFKNKNYDLNKIKTNYSIDDNYNDYDNENSQKEFCYIPVETDVGEYKINEKNNDKIKNYKKKIITDSGMRANNYIIDIKYKEKKNKNNTNIKEKKNENKSREKVNVNKILRKNILSILFNHKKYNKSKNIKLNTNDKKHSINLTNIVTSFNTNSKVNNKNNIKYTRSNNNLCCISSSDNCIKKAHSKVKEKVSKLTKNFDINILNIEYLNTDINEIDKKDNYIKKSKATKNFSFKPKSSNKEESKNNITKKNCLMIETNFNNLEYKSNNNSNKNNNNYYLIKDDSLIKDNHTRNICNYSNIIMNLESKNNHNKMCNIIKNYKSMNKINNRNNNNINEYYNLPLNDLEQNNSNNNLINFGNVSKKSINNKNFINKNLLNEFQPPKKHKINNTLSNLNEYLSSNEMNIFNQKSKNKRKNVKNSKENLINIKKIKNSISKKNKLIALTKKKSFFTIRDTVINFDSGNGKIIILPTLNKSKDNKMDKEKEINKKSKSQQGLQKSSTNNKIQSNYLIKKIKNEKAVSSLLLNYKLNDVSNKTCNTNNNTNNNISKELSFNNKENILYNYCNYKEKKDKSVMIKKDEHKNSGYFCMNNNQNSQDKNYSKFNRVKIEEYYRNNMNLNYGNNHKFNKINLINNKNKKNHCITNLYMNNNLKIDITGNFNHQKNKSGNIIKTNLASFSKNDININKNNNSNSSNNIMIKNDQNNNRHRHDYIYNYKSAHKKMLNLTHRAEAGIQKVLKDIMNKN